jgi:hypothetical protein
MKSLLDTPKNIIGVIISQMRWMGYVAHTGDKENIYSGTSLHRSCYLRFPAYIVCLIWSRN